MTCAYLQSFNSKASEFEDAESIEDEAYDEAEKVEGNNRKMV